MQRIWKAFGLQTAPVGDVHAFRRPAVRGQGADIVGLYLSPPDRAPVLCVDEKSRIQALDRTRPVLPMTPGMAERRTHDYRRNGTTSLFAALDIAPVSSSASATSATGRGSSLLPQGNRRPCSDDLDIHIVMDNYATHKPQR